ncbi:MAG: hypothetical protein LAP38_05515 [Acidobacteriia bacterium]|nr:hypothetical protein [Terriglobia bacterium]
MKRTQLIVAAFLVASAAGLFLTFRARIAENQPAAAAKFREADRRRAVGRGLQFIIGRARDPKVFGEYGADLLWCLYSIASTSADPELSQTAWTAARERAREYRRLNPVLPEDIGPDDLATLANGSYSADMIGVRDDALKEQIRRAATRFTPQDYLWYDPVREPPPSDVPDTCARCGLTNRRGAKVCRRCGATLKMQSRYDIWLDSLITTWLGERYGVSMGARYSDVIRLAPLMRPYRQRANNPEFVNMVYAVTHVVYTLNDYSKSRLSPRCLPDEFNFLKASLTEAIALKDPETMGEFLDSLRAFGLTESDPLIRTGMDYVLRTQNPDGSWGEVNTPDSYGSYHPTWTAVDGLREYRWKDVLCPAFPPPVLLAPPR